MRIPILAPLCVLSFLFALSSANAAAAQTYRNIAAGFSVGGSTPTPYDDVAVQASFGYTGASGLGWRVDGFLTQFRFESPSGGPISCGPNPAFCVATPGPASKGVVGVAADGLVRLTSLPSVPMVYVIAGVESDYLYLYQRAARLGASTGFGIDLTGERTSRAWSVEVRYHRLATSVAPTWFVPVTVGVTF